MIDLPTHPHCTSTDRKVYGIIRPKSAEEYTEDAEFILRMENLSTRTLS